MSERSVRSVVATSARASAGRGPRKVGKCLKWWSGGRARWKRARGPRVVGRSDVGVDEGANRVGRRRSESYMRRWIKRQASSCFRRVAVAAGRRQKTDSGRRRRWSTKKVGGDGRGR